MVKNVVRIKRGIITSDSVNVKIQKDIVCAKKKVIIIIIFGILQHVIAKMVNMQEILFMIQLLHVIKL